MEINKIIKYTKDHSDTVLTGVGIAATIGAVVCCHRDTLKADKALRAYMLNNPESVIEITDDEGTTHKLTTPKSNVALSEKLKIQWKYYIPTALTLGTSIVCTGMSHNVSLKKITAVTGTATGTIGMLSDKFRDYRKGVIGYFGDGADNTVLEKVAQDKINEEIEKIPFASGDDSIIVIEPKFNMEFKTTKAKLIEAEYEVNRILQMNYHVTIEDLYKVFGIKAPKGSDRVGWDTDAVDDIVGWAGYPWIEFEHLYYNRPDGNKVLQLGYMYGPYEFEDCE